MHRVRTCPKKSKSPRPNFGLLACRVYHGCFRSSCLLVHGPLESLQLRPFEGELVVNVLSSKCSLLPGLRKIWAFALIAEHRNPWKPCAPRNRATSPRTLRKPDIKVLSGVFRGELQLFHLSYLLLQGPLESLQGKVRRRQRAIKP